MSAAIADALLCVLPRVRVLTYFYVRSGPSPRGFLALLALTAFRKVKVGRLDSYNPPVPFPARLLLLVPVFYQ